MADVRVIQRAELGRILLDWALTPMGQLDDTNQLQTAVIIALATDRRANDDDVLPDPRSDDRRGWWGDLNADVIWNGWPIGSRLWLLSRAKITDGLAREGATTTRVETYIREALQPFLDNKVASRMQVTATRTGVTSISASVTLYRGPKPAIALQFQDFWDEIGPASQAQADRPPTAYLPPISIQGPALETDSGLTLITDAGVTIVAD